MSKSVLSLRIDDEDLSRLELAARYLRKTRSELVQDIVRDFLAKNDLAIPVEEVKKLRGTSPEDAP